MRRFAEGPRQSLEHRMNIHDPGQEIETKVVLPSLKDNSTGHSERKTKKRYTEEAVGRVDRNGLGCCIVLLFYVHGKHLRSCRDGQLT